MTLPDFLRYGFGPEHLFFPQRQSSLGASIEQAIRDNPPSSGGGGDAGTSGSTAQDILGGIITGGTGLVLADKLLGGAGSTAVGSAIDSILGVAKTPGANATVPFVDPTSGETTWAYSDGTSAPGPGTPRPPDGPTVPLNLPSEEWGQGFDPGGGEPSSPEAPYFPSDWFERMSSYDPWEGFELRNPDTPLVEPDAIEGGAGDLFDIFSMPDASGVLPAPGEAGGFDALLQQMNAGAGPATNAGGITGFGDPSNFFGTATGSVPELGFDTLSTAFDSALEALSAGNFGEAFSTMAPYGGFLTIPLATVMTMMHPSKPWMAAGFHVNPGGDIYTNITGGTHGGPLAGGKAEIDPVLYKTLKSINEGVANNIKQKAADEGVQLAPMLGATGNYGGAETQSGIQITFGQTNEGSIDPTKLHVIMHVPAPAGREYTDTVAYYWDGNVTDIDKLTDELYSVLRSGVQTQFGPSQGDTDYGH